MLEDSISKSLYTQKVRVRACGILIKDDSILMLKHNGIGSGEFLWSPPGGGVEFHETAEETVIKEFKEETGLIVEIKHFLFTNEYRSEVLHAIELFFEVRQVGGTLALGDDPEVPVSEQILSEVKWLGLEEISKLKNRFIHNAFHDLSDPRKIVELRGFIKFDDISTK